MLSYLENSFDAHTKPNPKDNPNWKTNPSPIA